MTKKRIRYSELAPPAAPVAPDPAAAEAPPVPAASPKARTGAPVDLARALAAARAAEAAAEARAEAPVAAPPAATATMSPREIAGRLTPVRGSVAISRLTPSRASIAMPRLSTTMPAAVVPPSIPDGPPSMRERARARAGTVDVLVFAVGDEWFAVELEAVEEAIDLPAVTHLPEMPPAMLGVIPVRETLTSLFSPTSALGVALGGAGSALIFRRARGRVGIAVDDVDDVHTLDLAHLRDAPGVDAREGVLLGVLRYRDTLLALVDADALISACQTVPVMETA
jgi:purine-binding chemotaxis protein CheW